MNYRKYPIETEVFKKELLKTYGSRKAGVVYTSLYQRFETLRKRPPDFIPDWEYDEAIRQIQNPLTTLPEILDPNSTLKEHIEHEDYGELVLHSLEQAFTYDNDCFSGLAA
jgi:hypothetical protein